jgi:hypothetical protein
MPAKNINSSLFLEILEAHKEKNGFSDSKFFKPPEDVDPEIAMYLCMMKYLEGYYDTSGETPVFKIRFSGRAYK